MFFFLSSPNLRQARLAVACFWNWKSLVSLLLKGTVNFSSLNLSIRMQNLLSPSPCPCFGPFSSSSLPLWFYLVLALVLSFILPPYSKGSSVLWRHFLFSVSFCAVSGWTENTKHRRKYLEKTCLYMVKVKHFFLFHIISSLPSHIISSPCSWDHFRHVTVCTVEICNSK